MWPGIVEEGVPKPQPGHTLTVLRGPASGGVTMRGGGARKGEEGQQRKI